MGSMSHNARVLCLSGDQDIKHEMKLVNAEDAGIAHMLPKAKHYLVKLEHIRGPVVHILKETMLSNGGDATVNGDVIVAKVTHSDVILMGTRKQLNRVVKALPEQAFGCEKIASQIAAAIRNYDSTPGIPDARSHLDPRVPVIFDRIGVRTLVMGILNVTDDSFTDGGRFADVGAAIRHGMDMVRDGADIIDVGGESTRPGANFVSAEEEIDRVVPVIRELSQEVDAAISIDTHKATVAEAALDAGASIVNDISAGTLDARMPALVAKRKCPAILMHIKGTVGDMRENPVYADLMGEITGFLRDRLDAFVSAGADERLLMVDPGFGFGKTVHHNLEILRRLREIKSLGRPILIGTSRKSTIGKVLGDLPPDERIEGTAATVAISIANGADIVRVHDVKEMARVARMTDAVVRQGPASKA